MSEGCQCEADATVTENRGDRVGSKNAAKVASSLRQRRRGMSRCHAKTGKPNDNKLKGTCILKRNPTFPNSFREFRFLGENGVYGLP
jgi:hypothetical protein